MELLFRYGLPLLGGGAVAAVAVWYVMSLRLKVLRAEVTAGQALLERESSLKRVVETDRDAALARVDQWEETNRKTSEAYEQQIRDLKADKEKRDAVFREALLELEARDRPLAAAVSSAAVKRMQEAVPDPIDEVPTGPQIVRKTTSPKKGRPGGGSR